MICSQVCFFTSLERLTRSLPLVYIVVAAASIRVNTVYIGQRSDQSESSKSHRRHAPKLRETPTRHLHHLPFAVVCRGEPSPWRQPRAGDASILELSLLTLGAHVQEGYGTCPVCLSVCLSVCLLPLNRQHRSFLRSNHR